MSEASRYPAEWEKQKSTWLAFPHNQEQWADNLDGIREFFLRLMDIILDFQNINLIFDNQKLLFEHKQSLEFLRSKKHKLFTHIIPNNDIWIRDYGPFFMEDSSLLDFGFNAWGEKFHPWHEDNNVPNNIAQLLERHSIVHSMILEGGSVEFSGDGLLMTSEQCLLNKNRNPQLSRKEIETNLKEAFGVNQIIWLKRGLEGDHTDGHIDDFARFVGRRHVLICHSEDRNDPNYEDLEENYRALKAFDGGALTLTRLALPEAMFLSDGSRLPCSYANFIFVNNALIVPTFACDNDAKAIKVLEKIFPKRKIIGIDSRLLIQEGGGLHCMSKQEN
jgi:agmatine deiminase